MPCMSAKSRAARSAPVWPPEISFLMLLGKELLQSFECFLLRGFFDLADLFHKTNLVYRADLVKNDRPSVVQEVNGNSSGVVSRRRGKRSYYHMADVAVHLVG